MANTNAAERPVRIFFTTRSGGASQPPYQGLNLGDHVGDDPAAVARNRAHVAESIGLPVDRFVYMEQVHSPHRHRGRFHDPHACGTHRCHRHYRA